MKELFLVGKISAPYGSDGFVTINSFSDFPERFFNLKSVSVEIFGKVKELFIEDVDEVRNNIALKFKNFDSDRDVEFLSGKNIYIYEDELIKLDKDQFYIHDLIGSKVFRNNEEVGSVVDVLSLESNDVIVIKTLSEEELLIPAVKDFVDLVDTEKKVLILRTGDDDLYDED